VLFASWQIETIAYSFRFLLCRINAKIKLPKWPVDGKKGFTDSEAFVARTLVIALVSGRSFKQVFWNHYSATNPMNIESKVRV
jgi:hypothetical protein